MGDSTPDSRPPAGGCPGPTHSIIKPGSRLINSHSYGTSYGAAPPPNPHRGRVRPKPTRALPRAHAGPSGAALTPVPPRPGTRYPVPGSVRSPRPVLSHWYLPSCSSTEPVRSVPALGRTRQACCGGRVPTKALPSPGFGTRRAERRTKLCLCGAGEQTAPGSTAGHRPRGTGRSVNAHRCSGVAPTAHSPPSTPTARLRCRHPTPGSQPADPPGAWVYPGPLHHRRWVLCTHPASRLNPSAALSAPRSSAP